MLLRRTVSLSSQDLSKKALFLVGFMMVKRARELQAMSFSTATQGTIIKVEEENAFIHFICGNCKSDKIQEAGDGHIDCISCGHKSVLHSQGYFLEVWLDCGPDLQQTYVKVKLYQKTIKKLLLACCGPQEEKYSATCLLGHHVGPMACVLLQLHRPHHCSNWTCILAELPY
ncbi:uncharacterized protein LOC135106437 isoform X9 [Scylla paramamosain]|uniref:uncharacterized protein LOC135106437 isoform X9 n=1 Tax=Scylla paramamosain TaxID=85552 RepID=UPI0030827FD2